MKKLLLLPAILLAFAACQNDDGEPVYTYPSTLELTDVKLTSGVKLYSKHGLITNQNAINKWRERTGFDFFRWDDYASAEFNYTGQVTFQDTDTLTTPLSAPYDKLVIREQDEYKTFYWRDTMYYQSSPLQTFNTILDNLGALKVYRQHVQSPVSQYGADFIYRGLIAKGTPEELTFPHISYAITRRFPGSDIYAFYSEQFYNNAFDPAVISLLQDGDTLAIQEARAVYKKQ